MTELEAPQAGPRPFSKRRVPTLDDAAAIGVARELALIFAEGAADRDRDRVVPYRQVEDLSRTGLLAITIPKAHGGSDVSPHTLAEVIRILAAADPNVAQIPHSHFVYLNLLKVAGTPEQQRFFFGEVLSGGVLGRAESEPGSGGDVVDARLTRNEPGSFRLNGHKDYCTGAIFATWIPTLAKLDDGTPEGGEDLIAFVDRTAAGVTVVDDWGGMGQRTTASGSVVFADVTVPAEHIIRRAKALDRPRGLWRVRPTPALCRRGRDRRRRAGRGSGVRPVGVSARRACGRISGAGRPDGRPALRRAHRRGPRG